MLKSFVFTFITLVASNAIIVAQDLTASQIVPNTVAAGSSFTVEIKVNRGNVSGFMKFYQELPKGFTATEIDSKGGSFSSLENGVKIVWIAPPKEISYSVSYKITVPADASGAKNLTAKYSYIKNNERSFFDLAPQTITVKNDGQLTKTETPKVLDASFDDNTTITSPKSAENANVEKAELENGSKSKISSDNKPANTEVESNVVKTSKPEASKKSYRVQIGAFSAKKDFKDVAEVTTLTLENGITKYFSGNFTSKEQAIKRQEKLSKEGYPKSFIATFENGKIIAE
ncbi:MAG: SPOR domain-containing protein [Bacteroidia bacterium]